jgi:hypothetical protein
MSLLSSAQHAALRRIARVSRSIFEGIPPIGTDEYAGITGSLTAGSLARLLDVLLRQVVSDEDGHGRRNGSVVLDVGSGQGKFIASAAVVLGKGWRVLGVERNPLAVNASRQLLGRLAAAPGGHHCRVRVTAADFLNVHRLDPNISLIYTFSFHQQVLEHLIHLVRSHPGVRYVAIVERPHLLRRLGLLRNHEHFRVVPRLRMQGSGRHMTGFVLHRTAFAEKETATLPPPCVGGEMMLWPAVTHPEEHEHATKNTKESHMVLRSGRALLSVRVKDL